jgi:23S rRNA-/tRNA-specific pseudouridylate synthase
MIHPKVPHAIPKWGITKIVDIVIDKETVVLTCEILTGRTHQIRYHCAELGIPINGDYLYNPFRTDNTLALTAIELAFDDPDGKQQHFVWNQEKS